MLYSFSLIHESLITEYIGLIYSNAAGGSVYIHSDECGRKLCLHHVRVFML